MQEESLMGTQLVAVSYPVMPRVTELLG